MFLLGPNWWKGVGWIDWPTSFYWDENIIIHHDRICSVKVSAWNPDRSSLFSQTETNKWFWTNNQNFYFLSKLGISQTISLLWGSMWAPLFEVGDTKKAQKEAITWWRLISKSQCGQYPSSPRNKVSPRIGSRWVAEPELPCPASVWLILSLNIMQGQYRAGNRSPFWPRAGTPPALTAKPGCGGGRRGTRHRTLASHGTQDTLTGKI